MLTPGQFWYMRDKSNDSAEVFYGEIIKVCGDAVVVYVVPESGWNEGPVSYDARLLDFVGRDYEQEEKRAQERFLDQIRVHDDTAFKENMLGSFADEGEEVESISADLFSRIPTKPSWWTRLKIWWITHAY